MNTDALAPLPAAPAPRIDPVALLLADKRSEATRRGYAADLRHFFVFIGCEGEHAAEDVLAFLRLDAPALALRLAEYKADMLRRGLAEATINRRLAAVRSLLKFSYRLGLASVDGRGLVDSEKARAYRNTKGVNLDTLRRLLDAPDPATLRGLRDRAILRLMAEVALRRAEIVRLNVNDFSASEAVLQVLGKGHGSQREPMTLSTKCVQAVREYLSAAGHEDDPSGPLFRSLCHRPTARGQRLSVEGLHTIVVGYGRDLGLHLTAHKLRHSSITVALDATNGDVRRVQKLSRHADLRTLTVYDDNREDHQGQVTRILSELL
jgi:integrase/recombinase XerC